MEKSQTSGTITDVNAFYKEYLKAVKEGKEVFQYENQDVLVGYAKYVVEFLINSKKINLEETINLD